MATGSARNGSMGYGLVHRLRDRAPPHNIRVYRRQLEHT